MESSDDGSKLSTEHTNTLITIERTGAGLSMAAIVLTVISYLAFKKLRTTPNLFLVFASIANAGASIASMMGYDGLRMGVNSALCQAQGFIFEWFMQADPWWSCAMAVNVFLVFFNNADPSLFRKYTWVYCIICFGGPMVPAVVLVALQGDPKGPVIGDAASFARPNEWYGLAVTEVHITTDVPGFDSQEAIASPTAAHSAESRMCGGLSHNDSQAEFRARPTQQFETTCSSGGRHTNRTTLSGRFGTLTSTASMKLRRLDPVKMAYLRTSFIFGLSVLITWIPSSVNRLYSLANEGQVSYSLSIASGCVLPLQGVWNAIIFFTTSWSAVRAEATAVKARFGYGHREYPRGTTRLDSRLGLSSTDTSDDFGESQVPGKKWCGCSRCCGGDETEIYEHEK
ncbi:hypothetical protein C2857_002957 [Epichloe festucae Fl1]|uniref:G-protein coupled receptors family 2 profile 2 domain-containing protein n=1 Tax=Epichloe festucae (strain Fl1) TaxID=877507 RepID=A0A7U3SNI3_EPIFF|nr:hypothetical protein C2857_002957 [Epichloe festucae Fl1]